MREIEGVFLNQTKKKQKKVFIRKAEKLGKVFTGRQNLFESKIEEIKETLHDPIIDRDGKIEEIKQILSNPINNLPFKKKIIISQRELVMLLVVTTLNIKVMEIKIKQYHPKIILTKLIHI